MQELSTDARHVLFRDCNQALSVLDVSAKAACLLTLHATYAQWVPGCNDIIVAQAPGQDILVWYGAGCFDLEPHSMAAEGEVQHLAFSEVGRSMLCLHCLQRSVMHAYLHNFSRASGMMPEV